MATWVKYTGGRGFENPVVGLVRRGNGGLETRFMRVLSRLLPPMQLIDKSS